MPASFHDGSYNGGFAMNIRAISSDDDHGAAMARINELWDVPMGTPESDELDALVALVETYEAKRWPIGEPSQSAAPTKR